MFCRWSSAISEHYLGKGRRADFVLGPFLTTLRESFTRSKFLFSKVLLTTSQMKWQIQISKKLTCHRRVGGNKKKVLKTCHFIGKSKIPKKLPVSLKTTLTDMRNLDAFVLYVKVLCRTHAFPNKKSRLSQHIPVSYFILFGVPVPYSHRLLQTLLGYSHMFRILC